MKIGIVIGRFQVPELHAGHIHLLQTALNENERLVIGVGVARSLNSQNILDYGLRKLAIAAAMKTTSGPGKKYDLIPILDEVSDLDWSRKLDEQLYQMFRGQEFTLYSGENGFASRYKGRNKVKIIKCPYPTPCGTDIRKDIYTPNWKKEGFAAGVIHGAQLFNSPKMAVDFAVFKSNGEILMGKKQGENKWRLPGGMVDFNETLEAAAKRELWEECGVADVEPAYVGSFVVGDSRWPVNERPISALFWGRHAWASPRAGDDLVEVKWVSPNNFDIAPQHRLLVDEAYAKYTASNR
jgi:8-oxo-dGTP diphosphatase